MGKSSPPHISSKKVSYLSNNSGDEMPSILVYAAAVAVTSSASAVDGILLSLDCRERFCRYKLLLENASERCGSERRRIEFRIR